MTVFMYRYIHTLQPHIIEGRVLPPFDIEVSILGPTLLYFHKTSVIKLPGLDETFLKHGPNFVFFRCSLPNICV